MFDNGSFLRRRKRFKRPSPMDGHNSFQPHALPLLSSVPCPPGLHPGFLNPHAIRAGFHHPCPPPSLMFGAPPGYPPGPPRIPHPALEMGGLVVPTLPPPPPAVPIPKVGDQLENGSPNKGMPNFSIDNLMTAAAAAAAAAAAMNNRKLPPPHALIGHPFAIHPTTSVAAGAGPMGPMGPIGPPPPPAFAALTPQQQTQAMAEAAAFLQNAHHFRPHGPPAQNESNSKPAGPWLMVQQAR